MYELMEPHADAHSGEDVPQRNGNPEVEPSINHLIDGNASRKKLKDSAVSPL